jgi:hypothetical protein
MSQNRNTFDYEGTEETRFGEEEASSPETTVNGDLARSGGGRLQEKLERLYSLRVEIDRDIEALRRAMDILDDASP